MESLCKECKNNKLGWCYARKIYGSQMKDIQECEDYTEHNNCENCKKNKSLKDYTTEELLEEIVIRMESVNR